MGKTQKPLTILFTDPTMLEWPEIITLKEQGHVIGTWADLFQKSLTNPDLITGPTCWRMSQELRPYLSASIKGAQALKYLK